MFGISPLILIILPLVFQIIFGRKAIAESITLEFGTVCLISFISQIVLSIMAFCLASYNFNQYLEQNPNSFRCGMGFVGLIMLSFLFSIILVIVIIVQYYIKKSYEE
jgi:hypothetical protein